MQSVESLRLLQEEGMSGIAGGSRIDSSGDGEMDFFDR